MNFLLDTNGDFFNEKLRILKFAKKSADRFLKNCDDYYDIHMHKILSIPIKISISSRMTSTYGLASILDESKNIKALEITLTQDIQDFDYHLTYQIVSHELAHCIDFCVRKDSFHDEPWKKIHRYMGGDATTLIYG